MYKIAVLYITNGQRIHQPFPFQGPQKFTQIGIFGLKIYHLATLVARGTGSSSGEIKKAKMVSAARAGLIKLFLTSTALHRILVNDVQLMGWLVKYAMLQKLALIPIFCCNIGPG
jgi:hypothetical protein